jgi:hypothetical protein
VRPVGVEERRARLARRHFLAPGSRAADAVTAARGLVGLHATDPATVFLSAWARVEGFEVASLERALYDERSAVRHLAMRRTLFVFPRDVVPVVQGACTDAILARERTRLAQTVEAGGLAADGARWVRRAEAAVLRALAERGPLTGAELSRGVPELEGTVRYGEGRSWGGDVRLTGNVLTLLSASGRVYRGRPDGAWTSSRHRWTLEPEAPPPPVPEDEARVELVRRYLAAFGAATERDVAWWTGLGLRPVRAALASIGAVDVAIGLVLPDDVEPVAPVEPWVAFLPGLDPTTMGWKERDWYLGPHGPALFDRAGNAGPTVWWDGRIVGGWAHRSDGEIAYRLLEDVGTDARAAIESEAERLRAWLGDTGVRIRFPTPLARELAS